MQFPGMMGAGKGPAQPEWDELYLHQKAKHLLEHGADFLFSKSSYWMPAVCASAAACAFLFGGPEAIPALMDIASPSVVPVLNAPVFGLAALGGHGGPSHDGEDGEQPDSSLSADEDE
jgi:hypothetical protein